MKRKTPAANERFCEMAGATRPKFCLTLQRQWLVRAAVKPATSQSRHHVGCKCRATVRKDSVYDILLLQQDKTLAKPLERA